MPLLVHLGAVVEVAEWGDITAKRRLSEPLSDVEREFIETGSISEGDVKEHDVKLAGSGLNVENDDAKDGELDVEEDGLDEDDELKHEK
jgi:hypothetical protein